MKLLIYIGILILALSMPLKRLDIAKLEPVEAVAVYKENGYIVLKTDEGSEGRGRSVLDALRNLKDMASSVIYLDTADYLLIGNRCEEEAKELMQYLRESIQIGDYRGTDVLEEARYLDVHKNEAKPNG